MSMTLVGATVIDLYSNIDKGKYILKKLHGLDLFHSIL